MPALITQVEAYQPAFEARAQKTSFSLSRGSRPDASVVRLGPLEAQKSGPVAQAVPGTPVMIGTARQLAASADVQRMRGLLRFRTGAGGDGPTAAVSFTSPGAAGLRLGLLVRELPANARVRGYVQGGETAFEFSGQEVLSAIQRNRDAGDVSDAGRTWWTPSIDSEEATLEIALPIGASADSLKVAVPQLSHVFVKAQELDTLMIGQSGSCEVDVSCYPEADQQSRATAKMNFVDGGYSYTCSGTLLNDSQNSATPYFLTAHHCISTQTEASSLITYWSYRSTFCNARVVSPDVQQLVGGATLLYGSSDTDTSFLRLNSPAPQSASFAGWSASPPQFGQPMTGVHHPLGDLQKISLGNLTGFMNCTVSVTRTYTCSPATAATGKYLSAVWSLGTVESGSSGSGLFAAIGGSRYLVGQLKGGSASCYAPSGMNGYGRFDVAYNAALHRWLSPSQASVPAGPIAATPTPAPTPASSASPAVLVVPRIPVHRFYNFATKAHFYTPSPAERDYVLANLPTYAYEGVAFYGYASQTGGAYPVYRLYNRSNRRHFYTMARSERDAVLAKYPEITDEGIGWYAQWESGGTASAMYRFYNPSTGSHFYTLSETEKAIVLKDHPTFLLEGVAYHAWTTQ
ncbi:MAG: serine protease [Ramlibacter sp.]|nr:serine protease [Ramlibacter sp.]